METYKITLEFDCKFKKGIHAKSFVTSIFTMMNHWVVSQF